MNMRHASRVQAGYTVECGHKVDSFECEDETEFSAQETESGIERAEDERRRAAGLLPVREQEHLPSEIFFG